VKIILEYICTIWRCVILGRRCCVHLGSDRKGWSNMMLHAADGIGYIDVPCGKPDANGRGVHHVASSIQEKRITAFAPQCLHAPHGALFIVHFLGRKRLNAAARFRPILLKTVCHQPIGDRADRLFPAWHLVLITISRVGAACNDPSKVRSALWNYSAANGALDPTLKLNSCLQASVNSLRGSCSSLRCNTCCLNSSKVLLGST
jgi:hypothetical protein